MFKKTAIILSALVALSSCNKPEHNSSNGHEEYYFEKKDYTASSMNIRVVEYPSREVLQKKYESITKKPSTSEDYSLAAFTQLIYKDGVELHALSISSIRLLSTSQIS